MPELTLRLSNNSCPSIEQCRQEFFSNAIACDRDTDLGTFDGPEAWQHIKCVSAFDGVPPNEPANLTDFHLNLIETGEELRRQRTAKDNEMKAKVDAWESMQQAQPASSQPTGDARPAQELRPDQIQPPQSNEQLDAPAPP